MDTRLSSIDDPVDRYNSNSFHNLSFERIRGESTLCRPPPADYTENCCTADTGLLTSLDALQPAEMSEQDVRHSLMDEVKKHKSWRMDALKRMTIVDIKSKYVFRYSLQSFTETRKSYEACESFSGNLMQQLPFEMSHCYADPNDPWSVQYQPRMLFCEEERIFELPGSSKPSECTTCGGVGSSHCFHCRGSGSSRCNMCHGTGMKSGVPHPAVATHPVVGTQPTGLGQAMTVGGSRSSHYAKGTPMHFASLAGIPPPGVSTVDLCILCRGSGIKECHHCTGSGKKSCGLCGGMGKIRVCSKIKIKFAVDAGECVYGDIDLPQQLLKSITGDVVFSDLQSKVSPINSCPINELNVQSAKLIQSHSDNALGRSRIIQQRHIIECIPVHLVNYSIGNTTGFYYVVGNEKIACISNYPKKCSIL